MFLFRRNECEALDEPAHVLRRPCGPARSPRATSGTARPRASPRRAFGRTPSAASRWSASLPMNSASSSTRCSMPADVERRVLDRHVVAVVEDPGLQPSLVARRDRPDLVRAAGVHNPVPQLRATRAVAQVDLEAELARPSRARDDDRDVPELALPTPVVPEVHRPRRRRASGSRPCSWGPAPAAATRRVRRWSRPCRRTPAPRARRASRPSRPARARSGSRPSRSRIGSFTIPPSGAMIGAYLHCITSQRDRSRHVSSCVKRAASGPVISTWRSTATSHSPTCSTRCQYSRSSSSYSVGISMWLYRSQDVQPASIVRCQYGERRYHDAV